MHRIALVLVLSLIAGCAPEPSGLAPTEDLSATDVIELPPPAFTGTMSLEEALAARRSVREYSSEPLDIDAIGQLAWAAQGLTSADGKRTAPSAGGLYPLELYVAVAMGVYHYLPDGHLLELVIDADLRRALEDAALGQESIGEAAAVFIITAVGARTEAKYGERAERYVKLEAGHGAQNLLLQAVALGLDAVPVGAFGDVEVQRVLDLPDGQEPLYLIAVGRPSLVER